jgi:DNA invertase Pin-like site-specific DNA recombinase
LRISLDRLGDELGVERQEKECRALAERHGWTVTKVYRDNDVSATSGVIRPAFEELLEDRPQRVVTWATDRFVRLMDDLQRVIKTGMTVHAVTAGPLDLSNSSQVAFAQMLTVMAELEGKQKSERQQAQQRQRRDKGKPWWIVRPFGFEREGDVVTHHPTEAALIKKAYRDLGKGWTYVRICEEWNEAGVTTARGTTWSPKTVRQVLTSARNAGLMEEYGEIVGTASWEPIIPAEEWRALMRRVGSPEQRGRGQGYRKGHLSGIVVCARCRAEGERAPAQLRNRGSKARGIKKVYGFKCGHATAPIEWLDDHVNKAVLRRLSSPAAALARGPRTVTTEETGEAVREAEELRNQLDEATDMLADGELDRAGYRRVRDRITKRLEELAPIEDQHFRSSPLDDFTTLSDLLAAWKSDDLGAEGRRATIAAMTECIEVHTRRQGEKMSKEAVTITWRPLQRMAAEEQG